MSAYSSVELRALVAAQIAAALIPDLPKNAPESMVTALAEIAVKVAKEIEGAAARSLKP